jgi:hypothetical protein
MARSRIWSARLVPVVSVAGPSSSISAFTVVYQEIIAGRGHRIEDAADAVRLAERVRQTAMREPAAVPSLNKDRSASQPAMMRAIRGPDAPSHSGGSSPAYGPWARASRTTDASSSARTSTTAAA